MTRKTLTFLLLGALTSLVHADDHTDAIELKASEKEALAAFGLSPDEIAYHQKVGKRRLIGLPDGSLSWLDMTKRDPVLIQGYLEVQTVNKEGTVTRLSDTARQAIRNQALAALNIDDAIVFAPEGESRRILWVWTDVDCPFCQRLHQGMNAYLDAGLEIRYLPFVRAGAESETARKMRNAWCQEEPEKQRTALTALKAQQTVADIPDCGIDLAGLRETGVRMGLTGTPMSILDDGSVISGFFSTENLLQAAGVPLAEAENNSDQ